METPGDRLRTLRLKKGYENAIDAARAFGWNENTYKSHENGARGIPLNTARKYAMAYGSTPMFIMAGEGELAAVPELVSVQWIGDVAAGAFRAGNFIPREEAEIPAIRRKGIPPSKQYALRVDGPSVNRRIPDGMFAICALFDAFPGGAQIGSLVHVVRERAGEIENTIKELRYTRDGVILMPVSDDPRYQEQVALAPTSDVDSVRIQGVVIGVYQPL